MIPLRDTARSHSTPIVVYGLIAACIAIYVYADRLESPAAVAAFYSEYGATPQAVLAGGPPAWSTLFTSMFLHGSWMHLGGNMLYLWIFGDNIEDAMGHLGFLLFYVLAGILAGLAHVLTHASSTVPLVGASGAIAGVLGAYLILYPRSGIVSLIFFFPFVRLTVLPAAVVLSLWLILQVVQGVVALGAPGITTVAWWAHIGGFAAGAVLVSAFARRRKR
jgi:membrane associated rhomboid family serine protease